MSRKSKVLLLQDCRGGYQPSEFYATIFSLKRIWDKIIAANIKTQPRISQAVMVSRRMIAPKITANTDSILKIMDAAEGLRYFCPTIWK